MDLIKKLKHTVQKISRYWNNRTFRKEVLSEKKKLYLLDTGKKSSWRLSFFTFFSGKKRFHYFSTVFSVFERNKDRFRLPFLLMGLFLCISSIYILFFSPYFRISPSRVIIERLDTITDINIAYKSIEDIYGASIFLVNTDDIREKLVSLQKNIKQTQISRLFPNGLKVIIESYKPQFFVRLGKNEKTYIITSNGILIYQKMNDATLFDLELVDQQLSEAGFIDYKEGIKEKIMRVILASRDLFKKIFPVINIAKFTYFQSEREIHIALESGTNILLRAENDIEQQLLSLKVYNDTYKDIINSGNISYIDMRVPGKVFTCQDKELCKKNLSRIYGINYK